MLGTERRKREVVAPPDFVSKLASINEGTEKVDGSPVEPGHCSKRRERGVESRGKKAERRRSVLSGEGLCDGMVWKGSECVQGHTEVRKGENWERQG
jgi:hypothetical protein